MLGRRAIWAVCVLAVVGSGVAACGQFDSATPTVPGSQTPAAVGQAERGTEVAFEICGSAPSWERPSEEEQASVWESGRYAGADGEVLRYPWTHDFFVTYGSASVEQDLIDLTGLWTLPDGARAGCIEPERHQALIDWEEVELWVLLHRVQEVVRTDASYTVVVEPVEQGVQFVRLPRPDRLPLTFTFVTEKGEVVGEIVEEDYRYWPGGTGVETTPTPPAATETPTASIEVPSFRVFYSCGNQLCAADEAGEAEEVTEVPSSHTVTDFAVDPRQRWVVYAEQMGETFRQELGWVRLDPEAKAPELTFEAPRIVRSLAWSPSGDRLALVVTPLEDESRDVPVGRGLDELWVLSVEDGQRERVVPQNPGERVDWRWLHWWQDGRYLFVNRFLPDESGPPGVYALDLETHRLEEVEEGLVWVLDQNRHGTLLLQRRNIGDEGTQMELAALEWPTSTTPVSLTPEDRSDAEGRWSPDGGEIVFSSGERGREGGSSIWLMDGDGGDRRQLTRGANDYLPRWVPDHVGEYVLFLRDSHELHVLEIGTGKAVPILPQANVDYVVVQPEAESTN